MFVDEDSWKRFVPSVRALKDFGGGWAMVGDLLLCLPLSVFVQFTQINYKVSARSLSFGFDASANGEAPKKRSFLPHRWTIWRNTSTTP